METQVQNYKMREYKFLHDSAEREVVDYMLPSVTTCVIGGKQGARHRFVQPDSTDASLRKFYE